MDLPVDVGTGTITISLRRVVVDPTTHVSELAPVTGKLTFTPSAPLLRHLGQGLIFPAFPESVFLDGDGDASVTLMATNDAQITPINWTYEVAAELEDGVSLDPFSIDVPEGSTRALAALAPVQTNTGTYYLSSALAISTDPGNYAILGTDGKVYVPTPAGGTINPSTLVSVQSGNTLRTGTDSKLYVPTPAAPVLAHSGLTGLSGDDHTQYHNDTRGDVRYYTKAQVDSAISAAAGTTSPVYVCRYTASAYPTLPVSKPTGVQVVMFYGPTEPVTIPSWVGVGPTQAVGQYIYAEVT